MYYYFCYMNATFSHTIMHKIIYDLILNIKLYVNASFLKDQQRSAGSEDAYPMTTFSGKQ